MTPADLGFAAQLLVGGTLVVLLPSESKGGALVIERPLLQRLAQTDAVDVLDH